VLFYAELLAIEDDTKYLLINTHGLWAWAPASMGKNGHLPSMERTTFDVFILYPNKRTFGNLPQI